MEIKQVFCFGFGFSAQYLAKLFNDSDVKIVGTYRDLNNHKKYLDDLKVSVNFYRYDDEHQLSDEALAELEASTHILISIPPKEFGDMVYKDCHKIIKSCQNSKRIIYLSTIGVYGNHNGAFIDESSELQPLSARAKKRLLAENEWLALDNASEFTNISAIILRLPGIYGYKRSVFDKIAKGKDRIIIKEGQYFNRIHVEDIAQAIFKAMIYDNDKRIFNVVDGNPCPPEEVVYYAYELLGTKPPLAISFEEAEMSKMGRSFYMENKRVKNDLLLNELKVKLKYPNYRQGLLDIYKMIKN